MSRGMKSHTHAGSANLRTRKSGQVVNLNFAYNHYSVGQLVLVNNLLLSEAERAAFLAPPPTSSRIAVAEDFHSLPSHTRRVYKIVPR